MSCSETTNAAIEKDDGSRSEEGDYREPTRHRGQVHAQNSHRGQPTDPGHASSPLHAVSHSPMPFSHQVTVPDGQGRLWTEHGHRPREELQQASSIHAHTNRGSSLDLNRLHDSTNADHFYPNSSPSNTSLEPISSPDDEAPLSMSDSPSQTSTSYPLQPPQSHHNQEASLPPPSKPKLARVSSDPVPSSSSSTSFTPLSFQNQPDLVPAGNRPAGAPLPSHMHRQPTMDSSHHQPSAGPSTSPSRSTRYADPDSHWLSEDEGESFIDDLRNSRQSPRRRGGPRLRSNYPVSSFDHQDDDDDDSHHQGKNSVSNHRGGDNDGKRRSRTASSALHHQEELYVDSSVADPVVAQPQHATSNTQPPHTEAPSHRQSSISKETRPPAVKSDSETNAAYRDYAPFIKDLSAITPSLLKALTCPSCGNLMSDPTTLACGHSECLLCVAPKAASVLLRKTSPTSAPIAITAAVLTMQDENRFDSGHIPQQQTQQQQQQQILPSPALYSASHLESSATSTTEQRSPRATLADGVCPILTCKKVTKATANGRQGLRVDVVLQKLAFLLKSRVILDDEEDKLEAARATEVDDREGSIGNGELLAPLPRRRSPPLGTLLDVDPEEEGSLSEPILGASPQSPRLSRSRSYLRASSPRTTSSGLLYHNNDRESGPSNTSSPDEETKSEDNAKRSMKTRSHSKSSGRTLKKSRAGSSAVDFSKRRYQQKQHSQAGLPMLVTDILSELECHICVTMMYEPITTTCGHTFCKKCLLRSLDHSNRCPLCRSELPGMSYFIHAPINSTLSNLIITTFPILYEQRKDLSKQEENESGLDTPIFVCMVSFPFMPTNLHIYEPRYRLMMRRALDTNKRFGMVLPSRQSGSGGFTQYGTMLEIRNMHVFEDGRSLVETIGVSRFKVLESGTLDGYTVGKIERIDDIGDEEEGELERSALARSADRLAAESQAARRTSSSSSSSAAPPTSSSIGVIDEKVPTSPGTASSHQQQASSTPTSRPATGLRSLSFSRHRSSSNSSINNNSNNNNSTRRVTPPTQSSDPAGTSANPNDASASDSVELTNAQLVDVCKGFVEALRTGSTPWLLQRLNNSLPPMPDDPREFTWWMAMLMPIDDHEKARLLQITSYRLRLRLLVFWIQQMQHSWWFSRGCTIS